MSLAALVATLMLAVLIAFVGMVIWATLRQIDTESRRAAEKREG
jgi:Tfp pilus assembly protein PilX